MRQLGEQWIEDGRMFKAVEGQGCENCWGCHWSDENSCCDSMVKCPVNASETGLIVKDLGVVNKDGCLAEERTGIFPTITKVNVGMWKASVYQNEGLIQIESEVWATTQQGVFDAWNRRV